MVRTYSTMLPLGTKAPDFQLRDPLWQSVVAGRLRRKAGACW